jgi:outer membrane protein OmpU
MNNLKKLGMTALAASLVSTSVFAGELTVSGAASMSYENYSTTDTVAAASNNKAFTQANEINFNGGGELDNGMTVAVHFQLDEGTNSGNDTTTTSNNLFDNHSVTISSDAMGSFSLSGHGGSSAQSALDTTAAGDIFDNFDATAGIAATEILNSSKAGNNIMKYTLPSVVDGLSAAVSYQAGGNSNAGAGSSTAYGLTYTGVEGLTVSYGYGEDNDTNTDEREVTTMAAAYAYGPVTVAYTESENDATTATTDQKLKSVAVSYTISENLSVKYGEETFENDADAVDPEYTSFSAAYTSGGMTISVGTQSAENADGTAADKDVDYNYLTLGFAF